MGAAVVARWSLRRRLLLISLATSLAAATAGGAAMYFAAAHEDDMLFDARLMEIAHVVESFAEDEIKEMARDGRTELVHSESMLNIGSRYQYQVWSHGGALLMYSANAPSSKPLVPLGTRGFVTLRSGGEVRAVSMPAAVGEMHIQVAEAIRPGERVVASFGRAFFAVLFVSLGAVGAMTWWSMRVALRSIENTSSQLRQRDPRELRPLHDRDPPVELVPMIASVNALFERIDQAMSAQRRFIDVAAHELRTPLAGLRAHAQVAGRARTDEERQVALEAVMVGVDRTAHLVGQLLDLAHVDSLSRDGAAAESWSETVRFEQLFEPLFADLRPTVTRRELQFEVDFVSAPSVRGEPFAISVLLGNLVRNAVAYAPDHGRVVVRTLSVGGVITLVVEDSGPGVPVPERERVFERFYRARGQQVEGVGLGLSIVWAVAEMHRAKIMLLDSPLGGLRVEVKFAQSSAPLQWETSTAAAPVLARAAAQTSVT
jgi:two-component system OmpR family sensor kinase/two-component system sensor histidine kinase QseC